MGSAEVDLRWEAAGGWTHSVRLQHPEGVHAAPGAEASWWCQKEKEEVLHHPKKNKHKRKKVKLAVLKYYKVDENGKVHRLRRECPADECGAGVFMASHFDRHYCGKCCLTYCFNKPEDK